MSVIFVPSKSHPWSHRPSTWMQVSLGTLFVSKDETSFSSSIAIFNILADRCLKAFKKVSGWKRSLKITGRYKSCFCWILCNHPSNALAFLLTTRIQSLGFSGPSHCVSQLGGTSPFMSWVASFWHLSVNISVPCRILLIVMILWCTYERMSFTVTISMNTKPSTGSAEFKWSWVILILSNVSGL